MIQLSRIEPDPEQPRKQLDSQHIGELTASIKQMGVLQPISVRYVESAGRYRIIAGQCRFTASKQAGLTEISCLGSISRREHDLDGTSHRKLAA